MRKLLLFAAAVSLAACTTGNVAYHDQPLPGQKEPDSVEGIFPGDLLNRLAFIECDDMGELFNDGQLDNALTLIRDARDDPDGALIVTYVHGWNHNADPKNVKGNLAEFRQKILQKVVKQEAADTVERQKQDPKAKKRRVIGIYVGWRGDLYRIKKIPGLFALSYYNRNSAATRVAGSTASEVLAAITHAAHLNERSRSVVIGHSMGALITEASLIPPVQEALEDLAASIDDGNPQTEVSLRRFPSDLILLVNPASRALQAKKFLSMLGRWSVTVEGESPYSLPLSAPPKKDRRPLLVSVTSEKDSATGWIFATANTLVSLNKNFRDYPSTPGSQPTFGEQDDLFVHNAGHQPPLFSHRLDYQPHSRRDDVDDDRVRPCAPKAAAGNSGFCVEVGPDRFVLETTETENKRPYWIMQTPESVIPNHSNIFTDEFYRLLKAMLALTGGFGRNETQKQDGTNVPAAGSIWGKRLDPPVIEAHLPRACDPPPPMAIAWRGSQSQCSSASPEAPCFAGEPITYYLMSNGSLYVPQPCDTITWNLPEAAPQVGKAPSLTTALASSSDTPGWASVSNHIATQSVRITGITPRPQVPVTVRYSGTDCGSGKPEPCSAGEPITFEAEVPSGFAGRSFQWTIGAEKRPEQTRSVQHSFAAEGTTPVVVEVIGDTGRAEGRVDVPVGPRKCVIPANVAISIDPEPAKCELGTVCYSGPITIRTQYANESNRCYQFAWRVDRVDAGNADRISRSLDPGEHTVEVTVTALGVAAAASKKVSVCPRPTNVLVDFEGEKSKCTRETVCAGGDCWIGETIRFKPRGTGLSGCEPVAWQLLNGERTGEYAPARRYDQPQAALVGVRLETGEAVLEDGTFIRIGPPPPPPLHESPLPKPHDFTPLPAALAIEYRGAKSHCANPRMECHSDEQIDFSIVPAGSLSAGRDNVQWLFDAGEEVKTDPMNFTTTRKNFKRGRPAHAVYAVVTRDGNVTVLSTAVNVPILRCAKCK